jgi:hypothetical protein
VSSWWVGGGRGHLGGELWMLLLYDSVLPVSRARRLVRWVSTHTCTVWTDTYTCQMCIQFNPCLSAAAEAFAKPRVLARTGAPHSDGSSLRASPFSNSPPLLTAYHQITDLITRLFFALAAVSSIYAWSCGQPRDMTQLDSASNHLECCKPTYRPVLLQGAYNSNIIVFTSSSHANVPLKKSAEERLSRSKAHMPASLKPLNRHSCTYTRVSRGWLCRLPHMIPMTIECGDISNWL